MTAERIWVARPEPGATRTGRRLEALGHQPLVAPLLTIEASADAPPVGPYSGLFLTSANALADPQRWRAFFEMPVFAVGARTAASAKAAGFHSIRVAGGDAAALARLVRETMPAGSVLLHAAGTERKSEPRASLLAAGYDVATFVAYAAMPVATLPGTVATALDGDGGLPLRAMVHYSRRSASLARDLAAAAGRSGAFGALKHYCLSADIAEALAETGLSAHFVAERPNEADLLAGLGTGF